MSELRVDRVKSTGAGSSSPFFQFESDGSVTHTGGTISTNIIRVASALQTTSGNPLLKTTGSVLQTQYVSSGTRVTVDSTTFTEPSSNYRVTITPSSASNYIILHYFIPCNHNGTFAANTIFTIRAWREIGGQRSYALTSAGNANGSRNAIAGTTFRPNNGYDGNDPATQRFTAVDAPNTTSACTYGFEFKRETGGTGTVYFGYSAGDTANWGFDSDIVIVAQEIVG